MRGPLGGLELEDVGAEIAEDAGAERPGEHVTEVDDPNPVERLAGNVRPESRRSAGAARPLGEQVVDID